MHCVVVFVAICVAVATTAAKPEPAFGSQCSKNQVVRKLTVYEDGALEAECGPVPCGEVGRRCIDDQTGCRAETDVFSGMRWAANGESILLRCCTMKSSRKIYVGTDVVAAGSFYEGGAVASKELYDETSGAEYDFIANARTEQGGVRVWVYRVMCGKGEKPANFEPITTTTTPMPIAPLVVSTTTRAPTTTTQEEEVVEEEADEEEEGEEEVEEQNDAEAEQQDAEETEEEVEEEVTTTVQPKPFNPLRYRPPRTSTGVRRV